MLGRLKDGVASARARSVAAVGALAVILLGAAPMAAAAANRTADPILALAISGDSSSLDVPAPDFSLTDQDGRTVSLASLRGKVVLMTFLDPVCTSDCPIIAQEFKQAGQLLGAQAARVELVAVVANPTYRSTAFTRAFDRQEGLTTVPDWRYLTGSLGQLGAVWRHYGVTVREPAGRRHVGAQRPGRGHRPGRPYPPGTERRPGPRHQQHQVVVLRAAQPVRPAGAEAIVSRRLTAAAGGPGLRGTDRRLRVAAGQGDRHRAAAGDRAAVHLAGHRAGHLGGRGHGRPGRRRTSFWQLFVRPATASRWSLVTPPGVADNGGLVAAGGGTSLVVGFRPSQNLVFSPLATSTDAGRNWTPGLLDAGLADTPGRHRGRAVGAHPRAAAGRHHRGGADGGVPRRPGSGRR